MTIGTGQIKIIQVAKRQLALADEDYRALLERVAGVSSCRDLDNTGFDLVMESFRRLGFDSTSPRKPFGWDRGDMATGAQCSMIRREWAEFTDRDGTDATLGKWFERTFKISSLRFLKGDDARKAITALKAMNGRKKPKAA